MSSAGPETHRRWTRLARALLNDPRDTPLLAFTLRASLIVPAAGGVLLMRDVAFAGACALYIGVYVLHLERFVTMFHDLNHRPLFRRRFDALNGYVHWVLGPLHGFTPYSYFSHHLLMHHPTDNGDQDESSTLPYRRDSLLDFARYYVRFMLSAGAVARFLRRRHPHRPRWARRVIRGELGSLAVLAAALLVDAPVAAVVLVAPLLVTRTLLIIGNWGEHAFVDPDEPHNLYRSSTDIIGEAVNRRCFNVGYHIGHHLRPGAHFSVQPAYFEAQRQRYGEQDAVVLRDLHYPTLWLLLMRKDYDAIAERFVRLPGAPVRTRDEVVAMLRHRTRPVDLRTGPGRLTTDRGEP